MAVNTTKVIPTRCKCEEPDKEYPYKACKDCWKCKKCGIYGGCKNLKKFFEGMFGEDK